jgi:ABC-2 type transport system ATP-binding protein
MISAQGLARTYRTRTGTVEAVRGVDLEVAEGEIVGFLGPNGAGKTTTLRMLTTLLEPTAGRATIAGCDLRRDPVGVRRRIGYVAQSGSTFPEARVGEELVDHARLYGLSTAQARVRGTDLLGRLDLDGVWTRPTKTLSGGQRRRLDIAMGLIHQPVLVFLDEPTTGLDPQSRANLWEHVRGLRDGFGTTVFLTTHYLDEADALCDRVMVIDHGSLVATGTPEELKRSVSGDSVAVTLVDGSQTARAGSVADAVSAAAGATQGAEEAEGADRVQAADGVVRLRVPDGSAVLPSLLRELDAQGIALAGVEVHRPTLDDVFLSLTGRSLRDQPAA